MSESIQTKRCSKCKQIKPTSEFYKDPRKIGRWCSRCKTCRLKYAKEHRQTKKYKISRKRYQQSEKGKATYKRYQIQNPERNKAKSIVKYAVSIGKLPRPDTRLCHYCPKPAQQYHHHKGYAPEHWLDVVPVCIPCHNNLPCFTDSGSSS